MCGNYSLKRLLERQERLDAPLHKTSTAIISLWFKGLFLINNSGYKSRRLLNIYLLDLLGTYRGLRHSRGLPVRGQRTWSNGWSAYRSNLILRTYKIEIAQKLYGGNFSNKFFVAYLAEEVNNMWRRQWDKEWRIARKKRLAVSFKNPSAVTIDLVAMSKLQITKTLKSKTVKKSNTRKNYFTMGFEPDFTKIILRNALTQKYKVRSSKNPAVVFSTETATRMSKQSK